MRATSSTAEGVKPAWRRETRRALRLARIVWHILLGAVAAHSLLPLLRLERTQRRADALVRWWMRRIVRILGLRLVLEGRIHDAPALFVCNHISWLDIICLRATVDAAFVSKDDVARWPVIGAMAARAGTIFLTRGRHDTTTVTADRMTWMLQQRRHILVFPEGTTTEGRSVRPFYPRLYQAAIRTRSPVQAIALSYPHRGDVHPKAPFVGDDNLARHLWALLAEDGLTVKMTFCPPLPPAGRDRRTLADLTRDQVATALGIDARAAVHRDVIAI